MGRPNTDRPPIKPASGEGSGMRTAPKPRKPEPPCRPVRERAPTDNEWDIRKTIENAAIKSSELCWSSKTSLLVSDVSYDTVRLTPIICTIRHFVRAGRPFSNPRHGELTMMEWRLNGKSGSGSLHSGKGLIDVSEVALAPEGRPVGYMGC